MSREQDSVFGDIVDGGGLYIFLSVAAEISYAEIVRKNENHIRQAGGGIPVMALGRRYSYRGGQQYCCR